MKKLIVFFVSILFGLPTCLFAKSVKIKLAYPVTANYPYTTGYGAEINWDKPGVALDVLKLVEEDLDIEISLVRMPWKQGLQQLKQGNIDGLFSASFKRNRFEYGAYPMNGEIVDRGKKFYDLSYCFYKLKGSPLRWDGDVLKNQTRPVAAMRGYSIIRFLREKGANVVENDSDLSNFKMLVLERVDAVATYSYAGDALLYQYPSELKNVEKMESPFEPKPYYLMFSHQFMRNSKEVAEKIWDSISKVRESSKFKQLFLKY